MANTKKPSMSVAMVKAQSKSKGPNNSLKTISKINKSSKTAGRAGSAVGSVVAGPVGKLLGGAIGRLVGTSRFAKGGMVKKGKK